MPAHRRGLPAAAGLILAWLCVLTTLLLLPLACAVAGAAIACAVVGLCRLKRHLPARPAHAGAALAGNSSNKPLRARGGVAAAGMLAGALLIGALAVLHAPL